MGRVTLFSIGLYLCPFLFMRPVLSLCMDNKVLTIGQAIQQMTELTKQGKPFSFSFYSYTEKTGKSRGKVHVPKAYIRKQKAGNDLLLEYRDVTQQLNKHCYICLLVEFNGIKTALR